MSKRFMLILAFVLLSACAPKPANPYSCPDCNVLLISIDTVRQDHLPCYGYKKNTTPNICEFAERALLFENSYSQAPLTLYSLLSIITGKLVSNKPEEEIVSFYGNATHLSEAMHAKGYSTVAFTDHRALVPAKFKGFDVFHNIGQGRENVTGHLLTPMVLEWLEENHTKKFFMWVHYFDPHYNYVAMPEYEEKFGFSSKSCGRVYNGIDIVDLRNLTNITSREVACVIGLYDAELFHTDLNVKKILDRIDSLGISNNTLVILTADHGEEFNERGYIGHEVHVYNELLRVPLIIKNPHMKPERVKDNFALKNLFYIISNQEIPAEELVSRAFHYYDNNRTRPNEYALISEHYKLIFTPDRNKNEFFNLKDDRTEWHSINITNNGIGKSVKAKLLLWMQKHNITAEKPSEEMQRIEKETNEKLRSLGYAT